MKTKKIQRYRAAENALFNAFSLDREEHFIEVKPLGLTVRAQVTGNGPPLVFVHGGPNAGSTWAELVSLLQDFRCILLDRPGCGLSEPFSGESYTKASLQSLIVSTLNSLLDFFELESAPLVGSSFGGYWALNYAIQRPERVDRLILEGCPAMVEGMAVPSFMKSMTRPILKWLIPKLPATRSYAQKILRDIGHTFSVEKQLIPESFIDWYVSLSNHTEK